MNDISLKIQEFKVEKRAPSFDVVQEDSDELKKIKKVGKEENDRNCN